jgi:hypothetical protein
VETDLLKTFGIDKEKVDLIRQKLTSSEEFNFTKDEVELIYKLAGFDLLSVSEMRVALLLFGAKLSA